MGQEESDQLEDFAEQIREAVDDIVEDILEAEEAEEVLPAGDPNPFDCPLKIRWHDGRKQWALDAPGIQGVGRTYWESFESAASMREALLVELGLGQEPKA